MHGCCNKSQLVASVYGVNAAERKGIMETVEIYTGSGYKLYNKWETTSMARSVGGEVR